MGCWNGTCTISQLSIGWNDRCRIIFLRKKPSWMGRGGSGGGGFCYPTGMWTPVSLPIPAQYDDYGSVEDHDPEDWRVKQFLGWISGVIVEREEGPNSVHDKAITRDEMSASIDAVCSHIHGEPSRVRVEDDLGKAMWGSHKHYVEREGKEVEEIYEPDLLGYCLIREDIYQGLLGRTIQAWRGGDHTVDVEFEKMAEWLDGGLDSIVKHAEDDKMQALIRASLSHGGPWRQDEGAGELLSTLQRMFTREMEDVSPENVDAYREATLPKLRQVTEYRWVNRQMYPIRKFWSPQTGAGSQSRGWEAQETLMGLMQTAINAGRKEMRDDTDVPDVLNAFWSRWTPPKVWQNNMDETYPVADIKDIAGKTPEWHPKGVPVPEEAHLFVVDLHPDANLEHEHLWFIVSEDGEQMWTAKMGMPPTDIQYMEPIHPGDWR